MQRLRRSLVGVQNQQRSSNMKKLILAAAFVVTATSASLAQGVYVSPGYGAGYGGGYYNYAPRDRYYDSTPGYGYQGQGYGYGWSDNDSERGGSGPRVGPGSGMGIGAVR
jgi:hypothetical protein